jgi:hypothetical protein
LRCLQLVQEHALHHGGGVVGADINHDLINTTKCMILHGRRLACLTA